MQICPWALREGLILRRLDQLVFDGPLDPPSPFPVPTEADDANGGLGSDD